MVAALDVRVAVASLFTTRVASAGSVSRGVSQVSSSPCHLNKSSRCSSSAVTVDLPIIWNTPDISKNMSAFDKASIRICRSYTGLESFPIDHEVSK